MSSVIVCDECDFPGGYLVMTEQGEMRLCGGCICDIRISGGKAVIISRNLIRAALNRPVQHRRAA